MALPLTSTAPLQQPVTPLSLWLPTCKMGEYTPIPQQGRYACVVLAHSKHLGNGSGHVPGRSLKTSEVTTYTTKPEAFTLYTPRVGGLT